MEGKFENAINTGRLFTENNVQCVKKGKININGEDGYYSILLYTSDDGEYQKYELCKSVGRLYINHDKRDPEKSPDISGPITVDGVQYKFGGYKKKTESGPNVGSEFTKVAIYPKEDGPQPIANEGGNTTPINDEDIPF